MATNQTSDEHGDDGDVVADVRGCVRSDADAIVNTPTSVPASASAWAVTAAVRVDTQAITLTTHASHSA